MIEQQMNDVRINEEKEKFSFPIPGFLRRYEDTVRLYIKAASSNKPSIDEVRTIDTYALYVVHSFFGESKSLGSLLSILMPSLSGGIVEYMDSYPLNEFVTMMIKMMNDDRHIKRLAILDSEDLRCIKEVKSIGLGFDHVLGLVTRQELSEESWNNVLNKIDESEKNYAKEKQINLREIYEININVCDMPDLYSYHNHLKGTIRSTLSRHYEGEDMTIRK